LTTIIDQMTEIYVFVADYLRAHPQLARWRRSPNADPAFTDAEIITIALMQSCFGVATLKKTYLLIACNYRSAFPKLCSYKQWIARLHALSDLTGHLIEAARNCNGFDLHLSVFDSKPIPVCKPIRHGRVRLLRDEGAYFGKSSKGWFFGFKLHASININGHFVGGFLTGGNCNDREAVHDLALMSDGGVALADYGYRGKRIAEEVAEGADMLLITTADVAKQRALISSLRERVETFFSQLWSMFVDQVYSRSWRGLWSTIKLKLVSYNLRHAHILSA
jgi:Transposase DDE domain